MEPKVFDKNDNEYLDWMNKNPFDFIVNTRRRKNSNYFFLHRSKCRYISSISGKKQGAYTKGDYIKIVSNDLNELKMWFQKNNSKFHNEFRICKSCTPFSEEFIDNEISLFPDEIDNNTIFFEGAKKQVVVNSYERRSGARQKCIEHYGFCCQVCGMDFEKKYGIIGKRFIHVHHLKEISQIGSEYIVDPIIDLIPICPNCHSMIHQKKPEGYSIKELKKMIALNNNRKK